MRKCPTCETEIDSGKKNKIYCQESCRKKAEKKRYKNRSSFRISLHISKKQALATHAERQSKALICGYCDTEFSTAKARGPLPKYCSSLCKERHRQDRKRGELNGFNCRVCQKELLGQQRFLCDEHKHVREVRLPAKSCAHCQKEFQPYSVEIYSCPDCIGKSRTSVLQKVSACEECGDEFSYTAKIWIKVRFCPRCTAAKERDRVRRRRQLVESPQADFIDENVIWARDRGLCGICGESIDLSVRHPDRMCLTIDHIVPISRGGAHVVDNVRVAHFYCNSGRGNRE